MKAIIHLTNGKTEFFEIVAGVLHWDTIALYLFRICLDYVLQTLIDLVKENGFTWKKTRDRQYSTETMTDVDCIDDLVLLKNIWAQAEFLPHNLEQAARDIGLHKNADKTVHVS